MNFSSRLKYLRNQFHMTQEDLANKLQQTKANISKYETGRIEPSIEIINYLAKIFEVSIDYLLGQTNDPARYRDINADLDAQRNFDKELKDLLKDEEVVAFYDFAGMDDATKKEIINFIKFKKHEENNKKV
ncbi:MAG: helix-turn-helix domain-containing protein [Eubacteriaceae bacterium]